MGRKLILYLCISIHSGIRIDLTVRIYPEIMFLPFTELKEQLKRLSPRELTAEERLRYLHEMPHSSSRGQFTNARVR